MPKNILAMMTALLVSAFALSACGSGGGESGDAAAPSTEETAPSDDSSTSG